MALDDRVRDANQVGLVYDAFLSYSHAADGLLAPRLQSALQRFARPWWKRRAIRVFRDESSLSANPHLWSSITDALDASTWFVLLLSPEAAESEWVNREIEYWLEHKDADRILPVVTEGSSRGTGPDRSVRDRLVRGLSGVLKCVGGIMYNEHMFDTHIDTRDKAAAELTADQVEQRLVGLEAQIGAARAEQLRMVRRADLMQLAGVDGARSINEWLAARLDVSPDTARDLVHASRSIPDEVEDELEAGRVSFDRAVATSRLTAAGAPDHVVAVSAGHDIAGVRRLTAAHKRMNPGDEQALFDARHATVQLSLDQTSANLWASLTGVDSQIVTKALHEWADRLPTLPDGRRDTLAHRQADALVAICHHALTATDEDGTDGTGPQVLLTADLKTLADSHGTAGTTVVGGPRVGVGALEEALCNGSVSLDVIDLDGTVLGMGSDADVIPPRVRRHVLARDGACTADACGTRYRLQVHHIKPRSHGGDHEPSNLTTLCWYHHHVVVHGMGYQIDPHSPAHRRRFTPPGTDPPQRE